MRQYLDLLALILDKGHDKGDRTGTGTRALFGHQMRFDLADGFPLLTTKKLHLRSIIHELLWFLKGETNIASLQEHGVSIWDEWADKNGDLGPIYGQQWRAWAGANGQAFDQIAWVQNRLRTSPDCRRMIVSAWNVADLEAMALPACHCLFQFFSRLASEDERSLWASAQSDHADRTRDVPTRVLSCQLYQRSCDTFLGVPFNIASYALLTEMMAQATGHMTGDFVWTGGDVHLYANHFDQARQQMTREPLPLPRLRLNPAITDVTAFAFDDIAIEGYAAHPAIRAAVAV